MKMDDPPINDAVDGAMGRTNKPLAGGKVMRVGGIDQLDKVFLLSGYVHKFIQLIAIGLAL